MKFFFVPLMLAVSLSSVACRTFSALEDDGSHLKYSLMFAPQHCPIKKANGDFINVCASGADLTQVRLDTIKKAGNMWLDAIRTKYPQAKAQIAMTCTAPDVYVDVYQGNATPITNLGHPSRITLYTETPFGNILHEFGHAIPCLGDTYVGGQAGYCYQGQPKSVMCYGLLINELTADDIAGSIQQYEILGLNKQSLKPDADDDADGILNKEDRCPGTASGSNVWKSHAVDEIKWLGCAQGQTPMLL